MTAFLFSPVTRNEGESNQHHSVPALSSSGCKELVFLVDKGWRWAVMQESLVASFHLVPGTKQWGEGQTHRGRLMADTLWNEPAHIWCHFPPFFPRNT